MYTRYGIEYFLMPLGLKIKRHEQDIGHAQSAQPNIPIHYYTGSMEHAQRTPLSEHAHRTSQNIYKVLVSVLPQTWWSPTVGWMKASLISTNFLFQTIYQLLKDMMVLKCQYFDNFNLIFYDIFTLISAGLLFLPC